MRLSFWLALSFLAGFVVCVKQKRLDPHPTGYAFVTLYYDRHSSSQLAPLLVMRQTLASQFPLIALLPEEIDPEVVQTLINHNIIPRRVQGISTGDHVRWKQAATKLLVWNMTEFSKVAFVDTDVAFSRRIDEVFDECRADFCGVVHQTHLGDMVNVGFFVARPNTETFNSLLTHLPAFEGDFMVEQDYLSQFFTTGVHQTTFQRLPISYNSCKQQEGVDYIVWHDCGLEEEKIRIPFSLCASPANCTFHKSLVGQAYLKVNPAYPITLKDECTAEGYTWCSVQGCTLKDPLIHPFCSAIPCPFEDPSTLCFGSQIGTLKNLVGSAILWESEDEHMEVTPLKVMQPFNRTNLPHTGDAAYRKEIQSQISAPIPEWAKDQFVLQVSGPQFITPHGDIVDNKYIRSLTVSPYIRPLDSVRTCGNVTTIKGNLVISLVTLYGDSYFHFLTDALPRLLRLKKMYPEAFAQNTGNIVAVKLPKDQRREFVLDLLEDVGIPRSMVYLSGIGECLYTPSRILTTSYIPYEDTAVSSILRNEFLPLYGAKKTIPSKDFVIALSRNDAHTRKNPNENELFRRLFEQFGERLMIWSDLTFLDYESYVDNVTRPAASLREIVFVFSQASMIIGPHGAALTHILFSPKSAIIVELAVGLPRLLTTFWDISSPLGQTHYYVPVVKTTWGCHYPAVDVDLVMSYVSQALIDRGTRVGDGHLPSSCSPGEYLNFDKMECMGCPAGFFSSQGDACELCPFFQFNSVENSSTCSGCPADAYQIDAPRFRGFTSEADCYGIVCNRFSDYVPTNRPLLRRRFEGYVEEVGIAEAELSRPFHSTKTTRGTYNTDFCCRMGQNGKVGQVFSGEGPAKECTWGCGCDCGNGNDCCSQRLTGKSRRMLDLLLDERKQLHSTVRSLQGDELLNSHEQDSLLEKVIQSPRSEWSKHQAPASQESGVLDVTSFLPSNEVEQFAKLYNEHVALHLEFQAFLMEQLITKGDSNEVRMPQDSAASSIGCDCLAERTLLAASNESFATAEEPISSFNNIVEGDAIDDQFVFARGAPSAADSCGGVSGESVVPTLVDTSSMVVCPCSCFSVPGHDLCSERISAEAEEEGRHLLVSREAVIQGMSAFPEVAERAPDFLLSLQLQVQKDEGLISRARGVWMESISPKLKERGSTFHIKKAHHRATRSDATNSELLDLAITYNHITANTFKTAAAVLRSVLDVNEEPVNVSNNSQKFYFSQ